MLYYSIKKLPYHIL